MFALYLAGKSQLAIIRELRYLKLNKVLIYRTITRYSDTGSIVIAILVDGDVQIPASHIRTACASFFIVSRP